MLFRPYGPPALGKNLARRKKRREYVGREKKEEELNAIALSLVVTAGPERKCSSILLQIIIAITVIAVIRYSTTVLNANVRYRERNRSTGNATTIGFVLFLRDTEKICAREARWEVRLADRQEQRLADRPSRIVPSLFASVCSGADVRRALCRSMFSPCTIGSSRQLRGKDYRGEIL